MKKYSHLTERAYDDEYAWMLANFFLKHTVSYYSLKHTIMKIKLIFTQFCFDSEKKIKIYLFIKNHQSNNRQIEIKAV